MGDGAVFANGRTSLASAVAETSAEKAESQCRTPTARPASRGHHPGTLEEMEGVRGSLRAVGITLCQPSTPRSTAAQGQFCPCRRTESAESCRKKPQWKYRWHNALKQNIYIFLGEMLCKRRTSLL